MLKFQYILIILLITSVNLFSQKYPIVDNPSSVVVSEIKQLNSNKRETNLSITPDGRYLYFMSDRGGQSWSTYSGTFRGQTRYDGDIWFSENRNGHWGKPQCLKNNVNTSSGEDEPNIAPDGQTVIFQSWGRNYYSDGGPYYISTLHGARWGTPVGLGGGLSDFFIDEMNKHYGYGTDGMSVSPDGKKFIVACGPDYDGNLDLYFSKKRKGEWTYLKKMSISSRGDERSIFIAADGNTIYFASDAYGGFGGLDIFKATIDDNGNATDIKNIGAPFNTKNDDYGFIITANGKNAYFVRDGDIYFAELQDDSPIAPGPSILISGKITDCNSNPLEAGLILVSSTGEEIDACKSSRSGDFVFSIPDQSGSYKILNINDDVIHDFNIQSNNQFQEIDITLQDCNNPSAKTNDNDINSKPKNPDKTITSDSDSKPDNNNSTKIARGSIKGAVQMH